MPFDTHALLANINTEVIKAHFDSQLSVGNAFCESWKLLPEGYLFINSCYSKKPDNDVLLIKRTLTLSLNSFRYSA